MRLLVNFSTSMSHTLQNGPHDRTLLHRYQTNWAILYYLRFDYIEFFTYPTWHLHHPSPPCSNTEMVLNVGSDQEMITQQHPCEALLSILFEGFIRRV